MGLKLEEFSPSEECVKVSELEPDFWAGFDRVERGIRKIGFTKAGTLVSAKSYKKGAKFFQFAVYCRHEMEESCFFLEFGLLTPQRAEKYLEKNYSHPDFRTLSVEVRDGDLVGFYVDFNEGFVQAYVNGVWQPGRKEGARVLEFAAKEEYLPAVCVTSVFLREYIFDFHEIGELPPNVENSNPLKAFMEEQDEKLQLVNSKANDSVNVHRLEATADIALKIEAGLGDIIEFDMPEDQSLGMRWVFDLDNNILVEDLHFRKQEEEAKPEWCHTRILCDAVGTTELRFGNCMLKKHNLCGLTVAVTVYKEAPVRSSPASSPKTFLTRGKNSYLKNLVGTKKNANQDEINDSTSPTKRKALFKFRK
mmetsp:Transcript_10993/g.33714  ORF Transcript_10993/g.33714 Transcript_10993/m.33714 type:complete len:364 (-) Transcript_10993:216-1307(-)|eukprot:CAMPEP_0198730526 /NCGR_PEP_ID=MMETSP1475-20131203/24949_1 /TAXON_ID= ORGANISM="Unidentified sp., Strain CCMP1999" /NCGR_SAMPLE_ID=MMETSP1475 /ASSEMBLY_ACC=CAM_ASM_001111 /LENGTH=363 /DNA_ID=CAMNT_0044493339 /DNA_START=12 /DNA_END=1103 /DNA_ORIENTATION=+